MSCWTNITERLPNPGTPKVVANINQEMLPFLAHRDEHGNWRNSHSKIMVADIAYWLEHIPTFPEGSVPIVNPMEAIAKMQETLDNYSPELLITFA